MIVPEAADAIEKDQVFFKRLRLRGQFAVRRHSEAGSVKDELIIAAHHVHVSDGQFEPLRCCFKYQLALAPLADIPRGRVDTDNQFGAFVDELLNRIARIAATLPELL